MNLIVSDTIAYSKAVMHWLGLSKDEWHPVAYGDDVTGVYGEAKVVRPMDGVEDWHVDWFIKNVATSVMDAFSTFPAKWVLPAAPSA